MKRRTRKPFGERLIASMRDGLEKFEAGEELPVSFVPTPPEPPRFSRRKLVKLRREYRMTQAGLAEFLNVSTKTVESWEQGTRNPNGAALRLLQVMADPSILEPMTKTPSGARIQRK